MAKLDLASSDWCQLIFEGKNQAYGAYRMRANSPRRHTIAMLIVVAIAIVGFTIPTLLKLATPEQKEVMTEVTTLSKLAEPEIKQEEMKRVEPVAPPPPALKSSIKFTAPVIKKDEEVHEDNEIKSQEELTSTKVAISIADVKGNDEANGKDIADLKQVVTQAEPENYAEWREVYSTDGGRYQMTIQYSHGKGRQLEVDINGVITKIAALGEDEKHSQITIPVELKAGYNTIRMGNSYNWAPDIDCFTLTKVL